MPLAPQENHGGQHRVEEKDQAGADTGCLARHLKLIWAKLQKSTDQRIDKIT